MKLKEYPKTYEDFYKTGFPIRGLSVEKLSAIGFDNFELYIEKLKSEISAFEKDFFDRLIKVYWLLRKFRYDGKKKWFDRQNGKGVDIAFSLFMRRCLNSPNDLWVANKTHSAIFTYFDEFFPAFDEGNPFNTKYDYPFEKMNLACLYLVHRMPERMELLKIGEKKKMDFTDFMNYVINYIMSYNEEHGDTYSLRRTSGTSIIMYVTLIKKR